MQEIDLLVQYMQYMYTLLPTRLGRYLDTYVRGSPKKQPSMQARLMCPRKHQIHKQSRLQSKPAKQSATQAQIMCIATRGRLIGGERSPGTAS